MRITVAQATTFHLRLGDLCREAGVDVAYNGPLALRGRALAMTDRESGLVSWSVLAPTGPDEAQQILFTIALSPPGTAGVVITVRLDGELFGVLARPETGAIPDLDTPITALGDQSVRAFLAGLAP